MSRKSVLHLFGFITARKERQQHGSVRQWVVPPYGWRGEEVQALNAHKHHDYPGGGAARIAAEEGADAVVFGCAA